MKKFRNPLRIAIIGFQSNQSCTGPVEKARENKSDLCMSFSTFFTKFKAGWKNLINWKRFS